MSKTQLNVRLTPHVQDVLDAAVFVRGLRSPQPLLEPLLDRLVAELLEDERVSAALRLREQHRGDGVENVAKLPPRKKG